MRVLVAFDKFKDALTAPAACAIAANVLREQRPAWHIESCPLADGGEGFATILTAAAGGIWRDAQVNGPRGAPIAAGFGLVSVARLPTAARKRLDLGPAQTLAVIEMACASGLQALPPEQRDPWATDTRGTGELMRAAITAGADAILLGVGGSATHDVGLGALVALGWRAECADGSPAPQICPSGWPEVARLVPSGETLPPIRIACDVTNPLLGPRGAATVFGPQKGLRDEPRSLLEAETARMAGLIGAAAGRTGLEMTPGAGAAGGIAFGFLTAASAQLVPGFDLVEDWLDLTAKIARADLVITGEGRFDQSSFEGKGPGSLARRALDSGKRVWILAGAVDATPIHPQCDLHAVSPPDLPLAEVLPRAAENLEAGLRLKLGA